MGEVIRSIKDGNYRHKPQGEPAVKVTHLATSAATEKVDGRRVERIDIVGTRPKGYIGRTAHEVHTTGLHVHAEKIQKGGFFRLPKYRIEVGEVVEERSPDGKKKKVFKPLSTQEKSAFTKGSARRRGRAELERNPGLLVERGVIFDAKAHAAKTVEPSSSRSEPPRVLVGSGAR